MNLAMKSCSVLLNRNFSDLEGNTKLKGKLPMLEERKDSKKHRVSEKSASQISQSNVDEVEFMLRKGKTVNYFDEGNKESDYETSESETSESGDSSNCETGGDKKKGDSKIHPKKLTCFRCEKSFNTHSSYLIHKRSHQNKHWKCILCGEKFQNRQAFIHHMKRNHPEVEPFLCEYRGCEKSFKRKKLLEIHHKSHWKYMCRFCKKLFIRKRDMRTHILEIH